MELLAEPINDDKIIVQKELLTSVLHPKAAANMERVEDALTEWNTNIRLFLKAGGQPMADSQRRLALIDMLPPDISSYITMHLDLPEYASYDGLRKFVLKYVKVQKNLKRAGHKPAHLLDEAPPANEEGYETDEDAEADLLRRLAETELVEERVEILALMAKRGFRPPTRGQGGPRKPPAARFGNAAAAPPRSRDDIVCVNCGRKGHGVGECRQAVVDKKDRPCFDCGENGHISRNCHKKRSKPIEAIEDAAGATKRPAVLCVQVAPPRRQEPNLGDFIGGKSAAGRPRNSNRFQVFTLESDCPSELASVPAASASNAVSSSPE